MVATKSNTEFVSLQEVKRRTGFTSAQIAAMVAAGEFVAPVELAGKAFFPRRPLDEFIQSVIVESASNLRVL